MSDDDKPATLPVTRTSLYSGITRTLELPITARQLAAYQNGMLVQDAFPDLRREEREFIISGITGREWEEFAGQQARDEEELREAAADNRLVFISVTADTLGVVMDLLMVSETRQDASASLQPEPDAPEPVTDNGRGVDID